METTVEKQKNDYQIRPIARSQSQSSAMSLFKFEDNRPEAIKQARLQELANSSARVTQAVQLKQAIQRQPVARSGGTDDEFALEAAVGTATPNNVQSIPRGANETLHILDYSEHYDCQIHIHEDVENDVITAAHIKSRGTRQTPRGNRELRHSIDLFLARRILDSIGGRQPVGNG